MAIVVAVNGSLSKAEKKELLKCERIIEQNLIAFYVTGFSLWTIQKRKLYREQYKTFDNYVAERWKLKRTHAYQLINSAKVYENLSAVADIPLPANEKQIRPLASLPHDVQKVVWEKAVNAVDGRLPTGKEVKEIVKKVSENGHSIILKSAREIRQKKYKVSLKSRIDKICDDLKQNGKFSVILADPPWHYEFSATSQRKIENHYPTMTIQELQQLPVYDISNKDSVLFMWATSPKLADAIDLLRDWGFDYKTCMVWVKEKIGMGYYARQRHELLLIGTRGSIPPPVVKDRPDSVISANRTRHSQKPPEFYSIIEKMYPDMKKIELFARNNRHGWSSWGNEVESKKA